jgi:tetratricopeptide (TPR) repeat protein
MTTRTRLVIIGIALLVIVIATAVDGRRLLSLAQARLNGSGDTATPVTAAGVRDTSTDRLVTTLQTRLKARPEDGRALSSLGSAYLQKARETGDPSYYGRAEAALQRALTLLPDDVDTMNGLGVLYLARHQFGEAKAIAQKSKTLNPYKAFTFGVLGDAQVELGEYPAAIDTFQQMVDLRPDLSSYARVSYIRELHGDVEGAIDAMRRAVVAGGPATENTAWTQTQLGLLYFNKGDLPAAEREFRAILAMHQGYVPAMAGMARVHAARREWDAAIALLKQAVDVMPMPEYAILLGDVLSAAGKRDAAEQQYALVRVIQQLHRANGVELDLETALFDADHDHDIPNALERARQAYAQRPSIHAADILAWTLLKAGQPGEAKRYSQEALRLGTRDALFHYHAGMIALANGERATAKSHLDQALAINPHFSPLHAPAARAALDTLRAATATDGKEAG